jgi:hypothetical protein
MFLFEDYKAFSVYKENIEIFYKSSLLKPTVMSYTGVVVIPVFIAYFRLLYL